MLFEVSFEVTCLVTKEIDATDWQEAKAIAESEIDDEFVQDILEVDLRGEPRIIK